MTFDLFALAGLTVCAAIAISALSIGFGDSTRARARLAAVFVMWFILVAVTAATAALQYNPTFGAPGFGLVVILPIAMLCMTVLRSAPLLRALRTVPLSLLIGVHVIRILGIYFLILYGAGRLPAPFAPAAGWGDVITAIAAAPVAWLAYRRAALARPAVLVWNIFGLADLISAIGLGAISAPGPLRLIFAEPGTAGLMTLPWLLIPGFIVPLMAATHLAVFYRLLHADPLPARGGATPAPPAAV